MRQRGIRSEALECLLDFGSERRLARDKEHRVLPQEGEEAAGECGQGAGAGGG